MKVIQGNSNNKRKKRDKKMKKNYVKPVARYTGIKIETVMQNLSNGGDKGGLWNGSTKEHKVWEEFEGEEW